MRGTTFCAPMSDVNNLAWCQTKFSESRFKNGILLPFCVLSCEKMHFTSFVVWERKISPQVTSNLSLACGSWEITGDQWWDFSFSHSKGCEMHIVYIPSMSLLAHSWFLFSLGGTFYLKIFTLHHFIIVFMRFWQNFNLFLPNEIVIR